MEGNEITRSVERPGDVTCPVCEGHGWDFIKAADDDLQVDDPVDYYHCERCDGTGQIMRSVEQAGGWLRE